MIEDILKKTVREGECMIWQEGTNADGYPYENVGGKGYPVHRLMYAEMKGVSIRDLGRVYIKRSCKKNLCLNMDQFYH